MAKAAHWLDTDAEVRKRGEQTGLDTLVVHAVNYESQTSGGLPFGVAVNALSSPPGEYGRKVKTQRNSRGPAQAVEHVFNSKQRAEPYHPLTWISRIGRPIFQFGWISHRCCMAVVSSCREMLG